MSKELNTTLVEQLKADALAYSLRVKQDTNLGDVAKFFNALYKHHFKKEVKLDFELLDSPWACQKRVNEILGENKLQDNISHNYISHMTNSYKYLKRNGEKFEEELNALSEMADCYFYAIALEDRVVLSHFPEEIHVNEQHQLHNYNGPSMSFRDGDKVYHFSGFVVDAVLAETPVDKVTKEMILSQEDTDVRRELMRKVGPVRLKEILGAKIIDTMDEYTLLRLDLNGSEETFLQFPCTSTGHTHIHGINPDHVKDCRTALAFKFQQPTWKRPIWEDEKHWGGDMADFEVGDTVQRHGDVHLKKAKIEAKGQGASETVLHAGRNNNHCLSGGNFAVEVVEGRKYLTVYTASKFTHNEHGNPPVAPGKYEVVIDMEYDPFDQKNRAVVD